MAEYSSTEFGKLTGKSRSSIETYVTRGKVIKNENRKIDTSNPINALFLAKNSVSEPIQLELKDKSNAKLEDVGKTEDSASALVQVEYAIKKLQAQKLQKEVVLKDIDIKNKKGELIPTEKAVNVARNYSESLRKDFRQKAQQLVKSICLRYQVPANKAGEYAIKIDDLINQCNDNAINYLNESLNG